MKTFALILFVLNPEYKVSEFVIDYDMTEKDCHELQDSWQQTLDQYSDVKCEETS